MKLLFFTERNKDLHHTILRLYSPYIITNDFKISFTCSILDIDPV
jgi:hypothetical protein